MLLLCTFMPIQVDFWDFGCLKFTCYGSIVVLVVGRFWGQTKDGFAQNVDFLEISQIWIFEGWHLTGMQHGFAELLRVILRHTVVFLHCEQVHWEEGE